MAIRFRNDLYSSETLSDFEMATSFTRPLNGAIHEVYTYLFDRQSIFPAKSKTALDMPSKSTLVSNFSRGDLVDALVRNYMHKRKRWLNNCTVPSLDRSSSSIKVPASSGRTILVAIENKRPSISDKSFAALVREDNAEFDDKVDFLIHPLPSTECTTVDTTAESAYAVKFNQNYRRR